MILRLWTLFFCGIPLLSFAQSVLNANGPGTTYELINSVLAPNFNAVEVPDCNHLTFGRHIDEVFDSSLNKFVFRFQIHTAPDDDRCRRFDRQRNEIKTYDKSPDSLLAVQFEMVEYRWRFKIDSLFQPSSAFTHLHQIKAVGGPEEAMPMITLTARRSNPDRMELRYADSLIQRTIQTTNLDSFRGNWVDAREIIYYDEVGLGRYEIALTKTFGGDTIMHYFNNTMRTWRTNAIFLRPKWGIYRSLNDSINLRDENVLFSDFYINELNTALTLPKNSIQDEELLVYPNPANHQLTLTEMAVKLYKSVNVYKVNGQLMLSKTIDSKTISIANLESGVYMVEFINQASNNRSIRRIFKK